MTEQRDARIAAFLHGLGLDPGGLRPLAGDASHRRYLRIAGADGRPLVLMDAPPEKGEDVRPFVAVTDWLHGNALSAPEILGLDSDHGLLLLEDLGDDLFARYLEARPGAERELYGAAVDLLADLAEVGAPSSLGRAGCKMAPASYDEATLLREACLLTEWYLPGISGCDTDAMLEAEFCALVREATGVVADARQALVLRDYHAENLIWLPERTGHARVGLLDYQDALTGHGAYDLVSLLQDARRDTSHAVQTAMIARYLDRRGLRGGPEAEFRAAYAALGAQRNLKIIGIFARLALRDGKPRYLGLIPRVWHHLEHDLAHPSLAALRDWIGAHVPEPDGEILKRIAMRLPAGNGGAT